MDRYRVHGIRNAARAGGSGRVVPGALCRIGIRTRARGVRGHWSRCHRTGVRRHQR